jgi:hypothetical protein
LPRSLAPSSSSPGSSPGTFQPVVVNAGEAIGDAKGVIQIRTRAIDADKADLAATFVDDRLPAGRYVMLEIRLTILRQVQRDDVTG